MARICLLHFLFFTFLVVLTASIASTEEYEILKASQCFKSKGIPKVHFNCPAGSMIKINRAFHGIKTTLDSNSESNCELSPSQESYNCSHCPGDCMDDSMNLVYDWSTCMGNMSCTRTVMQSYMPTCQGTKKKFSDYLQVEYQCIKRKKVYNICDHLETSVNDGFIMSPNYPYNYPVNKECICKMSTAWESKIVLSLVDLLLETKNSRCRADWMMLRQNNQKHRHCGAIMTGVKNITSTGNALAIQFHTDGNDNKTQKFQYFTRSLKGFWMAFTAEPRSTVRLACRSLTASDPEVREIAKDDAEYDEILSTKPVETTPALVESEDNEVDGGPGSSKDGPKGPPSINKTPKRRPGPRRKQSDRGQHDRGAVYGSGAGSSQIDNMFFITLCTLLFCSSLL